MSELATRLSSRADTPISEAKELHTLMTSSSDISAVPSDRPKPNHVGNGLTVRAWSRPRRVSVAVGRHRVTGQALAERTGPGDREILVSLDGGHLNWVPAARVSPPPDPPTGASHRPGN